jgi:hypothetical protein
MPVKLCERVKVVTIKPFPQKVHVVISNDIRRSFENRKLGMKGPSNTAIAFVVSWGGNTHQYMFLPEKASLNAVIHESVHVINHIFDQNGIKFDDEIWAYHLGDLFETIVVFQHQKKRGKKCRSSASTSVVTTNQSS